MGILTKWLLNAIVILVAAYLLSGIHIDNFVTALAIALVMGILNLIVRPLLILFTLPLTIITLGGFLFVINALLIMLASHLVSGFEVDGFWWALLFSIMVSILNVIILRIFHSPSFKK